MEYKITNSELPNSIHDNSFTDDFKYDDCDTIKFEFANKN